MSNESDLRALWLAIDKAAIPIAELRDEWARFPGIHRRFSQLDNVYRNLRSIEEAVFVYLESKKPLMGSKPDREFLIIARASIENASIFLEIGKAELALL